MLVGIQEYKIYGRIIKCPQKTAFRNINRSQIKSEKYSKKAHVRLMLVDIVRVCFTQFNCVFFSLKKKRLGPYKKST